MILTCPNCASQFRVDPSLIPAHGREVRCASCKHQWHAYAQDPSEGRAAELTPPPPAALADEAPSNPAPEMIAYPDPEPEALSEPEESDETLQNADASARPEDAFEDDSDAWQGSSGENQNPDADENTDAPRREPHLISPAATFGTEDAEASPQGFSMPVAAPKPLRLAPLYVLAGALLLAVIVTSFLALPSVMQGAFGFVYEAFGSHPTQGLVLDDVALRERPSRTKARYIIEGSILNTSDEERMVPILRVAMIGKDGQLLQSREYEDETRPILKPGERYPFKASNLEISQKVLLGWFVIDIGNGDELRVRQPQAAIPAAESPATDQKEAAPHG